MAPADTRDPITRHLVGLSTAVRLAFREGLVERGHELTAATTHLVPNLPVEGLGMSALAKRSGLSLQRAGQLVAQLEDDGYVERVADERDGRARRVVFTRRGRKLLRDIGEITDETHARFADALGEPRFARLRRDLAELDAAIRGDDAGVHVAS